MKQFLSFFILTVLLAPLHARANFLAENIPHPFVESFVWLNEQLSAFDLYAQVSKPSDFFITTQPKNSSDKSSQRPTVELTSRSFGAGIFWREHK